MEIVMFGVDNGILDDRFGSKGTEFKVGDDMPSRSFAFRVDKVPQGTVCLAGIFDDPNAIPVSGFNWIHWCFCNLKDFYMAEDGSRAGGDFVQGSTSWHGALGGLSREEATGYGGPAPPDREHEYRFRIFALSEELDLEDGFLLNEMMKKMRGKILAHATAYAKYSPRV